MFYESNPSQSLRFGDIVRGYVSATPILKKPLGKYEPPTFDLRVSQPDFLAILSPCCSIRDKMLLLAPLIPVHAGLFKNPYFAEDLTRINEEMEPQDAVPPAVWEKFPDQEKSNRLLQGRQYALLEFFVYAEHDLLSSYTVNRKEGNIETRYYMIDFRNAFRVDCAAVISPENSPLETKLLELSIPTRSALRQKVAHFYSREPLEDLA